MDVDGEWLTVTRLDLDGGWGQNLVLYARELEKWNTDVDIAYGPDDDHICTAGEKLKFTLAVLPQNHYPTAITQVFCYIGPKGGDKQFFPLYNKVPGKSPKALMKDIEYTVPDYPNHLGRHDAFILEIGYGWDMQYKMDDAERKFNSSGQTSTVLDYLPVEVPNGRKDSFKIDLLEKFPTKAVANEPLSFDMVYRPQDHFTNAISQMFIYFKDQDGGVDIMKLVDTVPNSDPETRRGGVSYLVPDMAGKSMKLVLSLRCSIDSKML